MAKLQKGKTESLQELMVSTLARTAALTKLLIEKGLITEVELTRSYLNSVRSTSAFWIRDHFTIFNEPRAGTHDYPDFC